MVSCSAAIFCAIGSLRFTCARKTGEKAILRKRGLPRNYSAICGAGAAEEIGVKMKTVESCSQDSNDYGTAGQLERRVTRILHDAGLAGVSWSADLSCVVRGKKI